MDLKSLGSKAKELIDKRGGTGSLKEDAEDLKEIAQREGSLSEKAKAAVEAIKDPGDTPEAAAELDEPERATAPPPATEQTSDPASVEGAADRERRGRGGQGRGGGGGRGG